MGEYEDRYPEAYGRGDDAAAAATPATAPDRREGPAAPTRSSPAAAPSRPGGEGVVDARFADRPANAPQPPAAPQPVAAQPPPRPARGEGYEDRYPEAYRRDEMPPSASVDRERRETRDLQERNRGLFGFWRHAPAAQQPAAAPSAAPRAEGNYRGLGPRGYTRPDSRIRDDLCDRLTEDPYLDASDIDVAVSGGAVTLSGTVADAAAQRRAQQHAAAVAGAATVRNNLRIR